MKPRPMAGRAVGRALASKRWMTSCTVVFLSMPATAEEVTAPGERDPASGLTQSPGSAANSPLVTGTEGSSGDSAAVPRIDQQQAASSDPLGTGLVSTGTPLSWTFFVQLGAAYDTNILQRNGPTLHPTGSGSAEAFADASATWHLASDQVKLVNLSGSSHAGDYMEHHRSDLAIIGINLFAQLNADPVIPYTSMGASREVRLNGTGFASLGAVTVGLVHTASDQSSLDNAFVDSQVDAFEDNYPGSGQLMDVTYRHWFMPTPGNLTRRIEVSASAGFYHAHADRSRYRYLRPALGLFYRCGGPVADAGTLDLALSGQVEFHRFATGQKATFPERQEILVGQFDG